ncbi:MAG: hypothetical protein NZ928_02315 [Endomicrobia bacterium]|nr:hypothetical protein [Endomicrobiia bacterium]MDW8055782.1 sugar-binding protein [Elusimicrobiota bacterium]
MKIKFFHPVGLVCICTSFAMSSMVIIDNFDDKDLMRNYQGGGIFWFVSHNELKMQISLNNKEARKGNCLQISYDLELKHKPHKNIPLMSSSGQIDSWIGLLDYYNKYNTFGVYLTEIKKYKNFKSYDYLVLYVKGDRKKGFTRSVNIEVKDKKFTSVYTIDGITDEWQRFVIPTRAFSGIDLGKVSHVGICLNSEVMSSNSGIIYIDDIFLAKSLNIEQKKINLPFLKEVLNIDGDASDWKKAKWIEIDAKSNLEMGEVSSKEDLSVKFATYYERQWLFIVVDVVDNEVINRQIESDIWREDCVEVYVDPENDGLVWGNDRDYQIGFSPVSDGSEKLQKWSWFQQEEPKDVYVYAVSRLNKNGYTIEIAINWQYLNVDISKTRKFGFSVAVNDFDISDKSSGKLNYCWVKDISSEEISLAQCVLK